MSDGETGVFGRLGPRAHVRPSPRVGVTLASVGSGLVVLAALAESGNRLADSTEGSTNRWPGIVLCSAVLVAAWVVLVRFRNGPLATAGVAASALAVPPLMFFLTVNNGGSEPFSVEAVLFVSTLAWLAAYFAGPARGHGFYLGAALLGAWLFVLEEVEGVFTFPFRIPALIVGSNETSTYSLSRGGVPSLTDVGTISLLFGVGYLVATRVLDRRGMRGTATSFVLAGLISLFAGIALLSDDLEQIGTGLVLIAAGAAVSTIGALSERRATTWTGGIAVLFGAVVICSKIADDNADLFALFAAGFGVLAVLTGHYFATTLHEPDETAGGPSTFQRVAAAESASGPIPF